MQGTITQPRFDLFKPVMPLGGCEVAEQKFNEVGCGNFDRHIYCSIPTFYEMQRGLASAIVACLMEVKDATFVDLGASEGGLVKVVASMGEGRIKAIAVDPNQAMMDAFASGLNVNGATFRRAAVAYDFSTREPYSEDGGPLVPYYEFDDPVDVISEIMVLQFVEPERKAYIDLVDKSLRESGIAIFCEKFSSKDAQYYAYNEALKDEFKAQFFSIEEIERKAASILKSSGSGMEYKQVNYEDFEEMLTSTFKHVICFWDAGNFKGYACSQTTVRLQKFVEALPDLNSRFSTYETPFSV